MRQHEADQVFVRPFRIAQAEFLVGRALLAQQRARGAARGGDELPERRPVGRVLQVFDDGRLLARVADQRQHVSRRAAGGIVIDGDLAHVDGGSVAFRNGTPKTPLCRRPHSVGGRSPYEDFD